MPGMQDMCCADAQCMPVHACRLQSQLDAAAAKLEQQSAAAAKAAAEECERHVTAERLLQQQVQQLTSELAVTQVRILSEGKQLQRTLWHTTALASLVLNLRPGLPPTWLEGSMRSAASHTHYGYVTCDKGVRTPDLPCRAGYCVKC